MKKLVRIIWRVLGALNLLASLKIVDYIVKEKNIPQATGILIFLVVSMVLTLETCVEYLQTRNDVEEPIGLHIVGGGLIAIIDICALVYTIGVIVKYSTSAGTVIAFLAAALSGVIGFILLWLPRFVKILIDNYKDD